MIGDFFSNIVEGVRAVVELVIEDILEDDTALDKPHNQSATINVKSNNDDEEDTMCCDDDYVEAVVVGSLARDAIFKKEIEKANDEYFIKSND